MKKSKVLILTQLFWPEHGAGAIRLHNTSKKLIEMGYQVQVIAPTPNYPLGITYPGYKTWQLYKKEIDENGVVIHRFPTYPATGRGVKRLLNFIVFNLSSLLAILKVKDKPDYILMNSGPLTLGMNALILKFLWKTKLILFVADLWPKAVSSVDTPIKSLVLKPLFLFEKIMYKKSDFILCATESLRVHINKINPLKKVLVSPNGVDTLFFDAKKVTEDDRAKAFSYLNSNGKKIILYQGNLGYAHGIDIFLRTYSKANQQIFDKFKLCFVGGGSAKNDLKQLSNELGFSTDQVEFFEPVNQQVLRSVIDISDVGLITLKNTEFSRDTRPAKLYPLLSMGKPIFFSGEGEGENVLKMSQCHCLIASPDNEEDVLNNINKLNEFIISSSDGDQAGRKFCIENMDWKVIVTKWLNHVNSQ